MRRSTLIAFVLMAVVLVASSEAASRPKRQLVPALINGLLGYGYGYPSYYGSYGYGYPGYGGYGYRGHPGHYGGYGYGYHRPHYHHYG